MCSPNNSKKKNKEVKLAETHPNQHVRQLNNFHTLMGFVVGFNSCSVARLRHTFADVDEQHTRLMKQAEEVMSPTGSYKSYRHIMQNMPSCPALPYLGVYLTDLTFIEDGNVNEVNGMINFEKRTLVHKTISLVQQHQQLSYPFPCVEPLHTFLAELPTLLEDHLYKLSLRREPRADALQPQAGAGAAAGRSVSASTLDSKKEKEKKKKKDKSSHK
eukprot:TRINITY_DN417_c0_g2_i3.p1 TRINITY_DN417_c0_g2~~TRINITY_DN417_c0_g2_i3.p1  ORF type:complete len:216 (-),score=75.40 TRINITY_DN417_c0_g2_i3:59-706(-)